MIAVEFHDRVQDEADAAEAAIDSRRPGRGPAFRTAVREALERVRANPQMFGREEGEFRACHLPEYNRIVWYLAEESRVWVAAVAHERQSRDFLARRMPPP